MKATDSKASVQSQPDPQDANFHRFRIQDDQARAKLRCGWRTCMAQLQETSIDGFTVLVDRRKVARLTPGKNWVLEHDGAKIEVHAQWYFDSPSGQVQIALRRLRDLTEPDPIRSSLLGSLFGRRYEDPNFSAAAFGGFVLFLFCLMALPGLGDQLGTADRIENAFYWILNGIDRSFTGRFF